MLERVRAIVATAALGGIASVYLFGSQASGRAHEESDVDIAVLLDTQVHPTRPHRARARMELIAHFGGRLGAPVDLVILNDAPPLLGRAIVTSGLTVAVIDTALDHAYRRDVQLRAADLEPFITRHRRALLAGMTA